MSRSYIICVRTYDGFPMKRIVVGNRSTSGNNWNGLKNRQHSFQLSLSCKYTNCKERKRYHGEGHGSLKHFIWKLIYKFEWLEVVVAKHRLRNDVSNDIAATRTGVLKTRFASSPPPIVAHGVSTRYMQKSTMPQKHGHKIDGWCHEIHIVAM